MLKIGEFFTRSKSWANALQDENNRDWANNLQGIHFVFFERHRVVRDASFAGNCAGAVSNLCRIWRGILTLAPTSSIPRQSDEVAMKHNLCRATKLRV